MKTRSVDVFIPIVKAIRSTMILNEEDKALIKLNILRVRVYFI